MFQANAATPSYLPALRSSVRVEAHPFDWNDGPDPDAVLAERGSALKPSLHRGCHYLNPGYTVSSEEPCPDFFRGVQDAEFLWVQQCRSHLGGGSFQAGYRTRYMLIPGLFDGGSLFIDGRPIPHRVWRARVRDHRSTTCNVGMTVLWRNPDLESLAGSSDSGPMEDVVRSELHRVLSLDPSATFFVTPGFTVIQGESFDQFLADARWRQKLWQSWFRSILGNDRCTVLKTDAPLRIRMMVYLGTLVAEGRIHVPGLWPNDKVTEKKLEYQPFHSPTVPLDYLDPL